MKVIKVLYGSDARWLSQQLSQANAPTYQPSSLRTVAQLSGNQLQSLAKALGSSTGQISTQIHEIMAELGHPGCNAAIVVDEFDKVTFVTNRSRADYQEYHEVYGEIAAVLEAVSVPNARLSHLVDKAAR